MELSPEDIQLFSQPTLDLERMTAQGFPLQIVNNLLGAFFKVSLPENMNALEAGLEKDEKAKMYAAAHKLVGSARTIGVMRLGEICDQM